MTCTERASCLRVSKVHRFGGQDGTGSGVNNEQVRDAGPSALVFLPLSGNFFGKCVRRARPIFVELWPIQFQNQIPVLLKILY